MLAARLSEYCMQNIIMKKEGIAYTRSMILYVYLHFLPLSATIKYATFVSISQCIRVNVKLL